MILPDIISYLGFEMAVIGDDEVDRDEKEFIVTITSDLVISSDNSKIVEKCYEKWKILDSKKRQVLRKECMKSLSIHPSDTIQKLFHWLIQLANIDDKIEDSECRFLIDLGEKTGAITPTYLWRNSHPLVSDKRENDDQHANFRILNLVLALVLMLPASVIILLIWVNLFVWDRDGGPFFYVGQRLGKGKKKFNIYKIRTLKCGTEQKVGATLLKSDSGYERKFGKFLRETRLDELPQLFNIIKGDMNFLGPRPFREAVYEEVKWDLDSCRFQYTPGLTGYSQLFTAYRSPKRLRKKLDYVLFKKKLSTYSYISTISLTAYYLIRKILNRAKQATLSLWYSLIHHKLSYVRVYQSHRVFDVDINFSDIIKNGSMDAMVYAMKQDRMVLIGDSELSNIIFEGGAHIIIRKKRRPYKRKIAHINMIYESHEKIENNNHLYIFKYEAVTRLDRYIIDQYALMEVVVT